MSGPKVVRIVTRQEIIAICDAHLARLDAAACSHATFCAKRGLATADELAALEERRLSLHGLLAADRFLDLQNRVPQEIAYLEADRRARITKAAEIAAARETSLQRSKALARHFLSSMPAEDATDAVKGQLRDVVRGTVKDLSEVNAILSGAYKALPAQPDEMFTSEHATLARNLADGNPTTFDEWRSRHLFPASTEDAAVLSLLAELEFEGDQARVSNFRERWTLIEAEADIKLRNLRRESLTRDMTSALREARELAQHFEAMIAFAAEWNAINPRKEPPWAKALQGAGQSLASLRNVSQTARVELEGERRRQSAAARRDAVLTQLASLGYEVREGLQTALAKEGKVVLHKAAHPDYGVEVIAPDKSDKLAFRAVTFGQASAARNKARDADMEVLWCADFKKLQADLTTVGGHVGIESAVPAGVEPLKLIVVERAVSSESPAVRIEVAKSRLS